MNQEELSIKVEQGKYITFQPVHSGGFCFDQVLLPLSCSYLHTSYFRLHSGFQISQEEKSFSRISWEVLNILKENFPSKVLLYQENLDLCKPVCLTHSPSEELRRQISCLLSVKEENRNMTRDELEDLWHTLSYAEKINDQRGIGVCLETILQQLNMRAAGRADTKIDIDQEMLTKIIAKCSTEATPSMTTNKSMAHEILNTYQRIDRQIDEGIQMQSLQSSQTSQIVESVGGGTELQALIPKIEKTTSTRMCLFQLSESNDINRVTLILKTLSTKSRDSMVQMRKKYNLSHKLIQILKKYCNAEYGFEQLASKNGTFQYYLTKLMILLASDYAVFLEYLQSKTLEWLSQLIEEALIYANDQALQGEVRQNSDQNYLHRFLRLSLDFLDLAVSKNFAEFIPIVRDNLEKVQLRFVKIIQKRDQNPLLQYFLSNQTVDQSLDAQNTLNYPQTALNYDQLTHLRSISEGLYSFAVELAHKYQRVDGLNDTLFENHEDKYTRLFPLLAARTLKVQPLQNFQMEPPQRVNQYRNDNQAQQQQQFIMIQQVTDQQPSKYESLPTFSGCHEGDEDEFQDEFERQLTCRENQENMSTNVYLKNKIEQGFKRVVNSHQQLKPRMTNTAESELAQQQRSRGGFSHKQQIKTSSSKEFDPRSKYI